MDFSKNISENIKKLREAQHLTQEQLANSLGISYQAVSKWENAVTTPDIMMLPLIAQIFDVSIDDLFKAQIDDYENEAERWLSKYESSKNQDDFIELILSLKNFLRVVLIMMQTYEDMVFCMNTTCITAEIRP